MKRVFVLVEGQTEETFVSQVMNPFYLNRNKWLRPIIVRTGPGGKGGLSRFSKVKWQIEELCKGDRTASVTTMFDLYRLPRDFPGVGNDAWSRQRDGRGKAEVVEQALVAELDHGNFRPYIQVHEFEALLFARPECFADWVDARMLGEIKAVRETMDPEDINETPTGKPAARLEAIIPHYQKTLHGPAVAKDIGLDAMRAACPHFSGWLAWLDGL